MSDDHRGKDCLTFEIIRGLLVPKRGTMTKDNDSTKPDEAGSPPVSSSEKKWASEELPAQKRTPLGLISDAQAHLSKALDADSQDVRFNELKSALQLVAKLPTTKLQDDVAQLLSLDLPTADQKTFSALWSGLDEERRQAVSPVNVSTQNEHEPRNRSR